MNKHVVGAFVFSVIVGSFAISYALLSPTPVPELPPLAVDRPEPRVESCRRKPKQDSSVSFEILSSNLLVANETIVSKILIKLKPGAERPERIYVQTRFTDSSNYESASFGDYKVIENPFADGSERTLTLMSKANTLYDNIYLHATVGDVEPMESRGSFSVLTQTKAVLAIYGKPTLSDSKAAPKLRVEEAAPYDIDIEQTVEVPPAVKKRGVK